MTENEASDQVPTSSAEICIESARWLDTLSQFLITALDNIELENHEKEAIITSLKSDDVQQDLLMLADWFEARPHSNKDAWQGTNAAKEFFSMKKEEE